MRLHAQDEATKATFAMERGSGGYLHLGGGTSYASEIAGEVRTPNLNAAYFAHRGGHRDTNKWPPLDGFRPVIDASPCQAGIPLRSHPTSHPSVFPRHSYSRQPRA